MRIPDFFDISDGFRMYVLLGTTGESIYHGEISLINTFNRYVEVFLRSVRNILLRVLSRVVVLVSVYTEYAEIACMTRPHPVVRVAAELAYCRRGSTHETDISVFAIYEKEILIAIIKRFDTCPQTLAGLFCPANKL